MRALDLQSASRSILSFPRRSFPRRSSRAISSRALSARALWTLTAALVLTSLANAQPTASSTTTLRVESAHSNGTGTTLTANVAATAAATDPDGDRGSVTFLDTDASGQVRELGSAPVNAAGAATLQVGTLSEGAHAVRAVFSGNDAAKPSTSSAAQLTGQAAGTPDYTVTAAPTSLNLQAGVQGTVAVTITPINGFSNYVSLSCGGLPLFTTCTFLPSNVSVGANPGLSTMTLNTVAPSGKAASLMHETNLVYAFLLPGALGLAGLGLAGRRSGYHRGLRTLALLCVAGSVMAGASSCAQRYTYLNHGPTPNPGTPNGRSIIRIFGTSVNGAEAQVKCVQLTLNVTSTNTNSSGNNLTPCPAS